MWDAISLGPLTLPLPPCACTQKIMGRLCMLCCDISLDQHERNYRSYKQYYLGTSFLRSFYAFNEVHTIRYIFKLSETCTKEVEKQHVMQILINDASYDVAAFKLVKEKWSKIF